MSTISHHRQQRSIHIYRNYVFGDSDDADRLQLEHSIYQAHFKELVGKALGEYGLAARLLEQVRQGQVVGILDIGCAEGLYLHDVAAMLEEAGLDLAGLSATATVSQANSANSSSSTRTSTEQLKLCGIDINPNLVTVADEFCRVSKPSRPYLNFFTHDATHPFSECWGLRALGLGQEEQPLFDFIYLSTTLSFFPQARAHLARFYHALKPGGVILLRDTLKHQGEDGWRTSHPATEPYISFATGFMLNINEGVDVTKAAGEWLAEMGAKKVEVTNHKVITGGDTKEGRLMARNSIMMMRNLAGPMIGAGRLTEAQHQANLDRLYRELTPNISGHINYLDTLARKPQ